jgi:hypothetical protein
MNGKSMINFDYFSLFAQSSDLGSVVVDIALYFLLQPTTPNTRLSLSFCFSNSRVFIKSVRGKVYVAVEKAYYIEQNEILLLLRHHHVIGFLYEQQQLFTNQHVCLF